MTYIKQVPCDGEAPRWTPISYRQYWDFARFFILTYRSRIWVFDSPFLQAQDEYAEHFIVSLAPAGSVFDVALMSAECHLFPVVDIFPIEQLTVDRETRKSYVLTEELELRWKRWEGDPS